MCSEGCSYESAGNFLLPNKLHHPNSLLVILVPEMPERSSFEWQKEPKIYRLSIHALGKILQYVLIVVLQLNWKVVCLSVQTILLSLSLILDFTTCLTLGSFNCSYFCAQARNLLSATECISLVGLCNAVSTSQLSRLAVWTKGQASPLNSVDLPMLYLSEDCFSHNWLRGNNFQELGACSEAFWVGEQEDMMSGLPVQSRLSGRCKIRH